MGRVFPIMILLTIRLIKSFEYKTVKNVILHIDENSTTEQLIELLKQEQLKLRVYKDLNLNKLKIYFKKHGTKSQNLVINLNGEDLIEGKTLQEQGIEDETELSFFNHDDFVKYKADPQLKW